MSYGWSDDTGGISPDVRPTDEGHGFDSARKAYEDDGPPATSGGGGSSRGSGRSRGSDDGDTIDFTSAWGKTPSPVKRKELNVKTESPHPIVIAVDHTGSFGNEVRIIHKKLALLGLEVERYLPNYSLSLCFVGDATCDRQPLQVRDFDRGEPLVEQLKLLYPEGGGGDSPESYDLAGYYYLHHCDMPKAVKPLFVWILDAETRERLRKQHIEQHIGDVVQSDLDSVEILKKLGEKFNVYVVLEGTGAKKFWAEIYGIQKIIPMEDPSDIVELLIGIVAGEAGEYEDFKKRSSKRHSDRSDRVARIEESMRSVKEKSKLSGSSGDGGKAVSKKPLDPGKSKLLKSKKLI